MKIYVASAFPNKYPVQVVQAALRDAGHTITHDWTDESTAGLTCVERAEYLEHAAVQDAAGVARCDALVILDHEKARGAYTELGIALGLSKLIFVLDLQAEPNIFLRLPEVHVCKDVANLIKKLAQAKPYNNLHYPVPAGK